MDVHLVSICMIKSFDITQNQSEAYRFPSRVYNANAMRILPKRRRIFTRKDLLPKIYLLIMPVSSHTIYADP